MLSMPIIKWACVHGRESVCKVGAADRWGEGFGILSMQANSIIVSIQTVFSCDVDLQ